MKNTFIWKKASDEQSLMSHVEMRSIPPPTHAPWIAAMTGFLHCVTNAHIIIPSYNTRTFSMLDIDNWYGTMTLSLR